MLTTPPEEVSLSQAAAISGVSEKTIRNRIAAGKVQARKEQLAGGGEAWRILRSSLASGGSEWAPEKRPEVPEPPPERQERQIPESPEGSATRNQSHNSHRAEEPANPLHYHAPSPPLHKDAQEPPDTPNPSRDLQGAESLTQNSTPPAPAAQDGLEPPDAPDAVFTSSQAYETEVLHEEAGRGDRDEDVRILDHRVTRLEFVTLLRQANENNQLLAEQNRQLVERLDAMTREQEATRAELALLREQLTEFAGRPVPTVKEIAAYVKQELAPLIAEATQTQPPVPPGKPRPWWKFWDISFD